MFEGYIGKNLGNLFTWRIHEYLTKAEIQLEETEKKIKKKTVTSVLTDASTIISFIS